MRKALIVGIDFYRSVGALYGCVRDAHLVNSVLEVHGDGTRNFDTVLLTGTSSDSPVDRTNLRRKIKELFADKVDVALLYFAGHGVLAPEGGFLRTSDSEEDDQGIPLAEILGIVNASPAINKLVILDCCHSGAMGSSADLNAKALLSEGVTILTASGADQYSKEDDGTGVFTSLFADALGGGAANLLGNITPGSVYAHIDQSLGAWQQRPLFKTNVSQFISLREVNPPIGREDLRSLSLFFPVKGEVYSLDPSFEPESAHPDPEKVAKFRILQRLNRVNLVIPVDEDHMYFAAINSKSCKLTVLGEHYWNLVSSGRI